eukprot:scaffold5152_cov161-Prasinococcus_capsulatus_cf.AAC.1
MHTAAVVPIATHPRLRRPSPRTDGWMDGPTDREGQREATRRSAAHRPRGGDGMLEWIRLDWRHAPWQGPSVQSRPTHHKPDLHSPTNKIAWDST